MNDSMIRSEILEWSNKYDKDHPWWIETEKKLGKKFRECGELTKEDLLEIIKWKFLTTPRRLKQNLSRAKKNEDYVVREITRSVLKLSPKYDFEKIRRLCRLKGVGAATASVIMTFYDPQNYGVFDMHVWKELYGDDSMPNYNARDCLLCLSELRSLAKNDSLNVRIVEKALFKKNLDQCKLH